MATPRLYVKHHRWFYDSFGYLHLLANRDAWCCEQDTLIENGGLSALIGQLSQTVHQSNLGSVVGVFADLALLTSFLGVSLGLFEFLGDTIKGDSEKPNRLVAAVITFTPPLGFALFYPQGSSWLWVTQRLLWLFLLSSYHW